MLPKRICERVLTMGCAYNPPKGGVAQVLDTYSKWIYSPFNFIPTTYNGSIIVNLFCFVKAWLSLVFYCLFNRKIEVVHFHGVSNISFWRKCIFIYTAIFLNKKVIYHIHGAKFNLFAERHYKAVANILKRVDVVVALSESWKNFFNEKFYCKRIMVMPNIIPLPDYYKEKTFLEKKYVEASFLGYLDNRKGIFDILDMLNQYQTELRGKFLLHIGGNGRENDVKYLIKQYGIEDIVVFEGWVNAERKKDLLNNSDFYLLPSYNEGLPISILEAMSYHLPIVATPVGGIPEVVKYGENGFLITPGHIDELFQAVNLLVQNPQLRASMGQSSWQKVQPYLPENVEKNLIKLYDEMLKDV